MSANGYDYPGLGPDEFRAYIQKEKELASRREAVRISGAKADQ